MDIVPKLFEFLLKRSKGRVGLIISAILIVAIWLGFDFAPGQEPLTTTEVAGMALIVLVAVFSVVLLWGRLAKLRHRKHDV